MQNSLSVPKNFFLLVLLLCTTGVYLTMLLVTIPHLREAAGGINPLDMLPLGYDKEYVTTLFDDLGDQGRAYYLSTQLPLDMIYPGLFALTYTLSIATLQTALRWDSRPHRLLRVLPVAGALFDYLENINTFILLKLYPSIPGALVKLGSFFTLVKTCFSGPAIVIFCGLSLILIIRYLSQQRRAIPLTPNT